MTTTADTVWQNLQTC